MNTKNNRWMKRLIARGIMIAGILALFCIPQTTLTANAQNHFFQDQSHNAAALLAEQERVAKQKEAAPEQQNVQVINTEDYSVVSEREQGIPVNIQGARLQEKRK